MPIPADASDIHYVTREGLAQVSFLSDRMPDYLHRAGIVPAGEPLLDDENYGSAYRLGEDEGELPAGSSMLSEGKWGREFVSCRALGMPMARTTPLQC
ncbi:hypothetical protein [Streptomyces sp. NPDC058394]|uniref:hypothetical protein n=1 Tax=Streptomyces sp. NPDC058394 TaxID=3346477 RepID=UPI003665D043